jgi:hypothetical protein
MMRQFEVVPPPMFTGIQRLGSDIQLNFRPTPDRLHFLQRRDDLSNSSWTNFTNNILGSGGNASVTDPGAAAQPKRFYRIGLSP